MKKVSLSGYTNLDLDIDIDLVVDLDSVDLEK